MITQQKIDEIVSRIVEANKPDKIILFGSYASGNPTSASDIDLLVIKETDEVNYLRSVAVYESIYGSKVPVDVLVYTPLEFEKEKDEKYSFLHDALKKSKVLYDRKR